MRIVIAFLFCLGLSYSVRGQSCDCPTAGNCNTCAGGLTTLTLRYNGSTTQTVTASDGGGVVFSQTVNPNSTFTFGGTLPNDKFIGSSVTINVGVTFNASIPSNCGTVFVGNSYGAFTIAAANSKNGGLLCCSAANIEKTPPVISGCPASFAVELPDNSCTVAGGWTAPTATDNCGFPTISANILPTAPLSLGVNNIQYTATDNYNNTSSCNFSVTVADKTKPVISNCPADITIEATSMCEALVNWVEPTATDNCSQILTKTHSPGAAFPIGTTEVKYTSTDPSGNKETCSFKIIIKDTTAPIVSDCPADITLTTTSQCEAIATWTLPTVSDNCSAALTSTHEPGASFALGTTKVTYTATDDVGNKTNCSFNVIVKTDDAPSIKSCPADLEVHTYDDDLIVNWDPPVATAACGNLTTSASNQPGSRFTPGTYKISYEFADGTGNKTTCSFNLTVIKDGIEFGIAKAVTPNGDGTNDYWELKDIENFDDNSVTVVDRWGNKIYQASGYDNTNVFWNGNGPSGSKVPIGTYFYTIEVRVNGSRIRKTGFIEVIY